MFSTILFPLVLYRVLAAELLVSQGLVDTLDSTHLEAMFKHEQGHYYYRDTFWFFWLGWVRSYTA